MSSSIAGRPGSADNLFLSSDLFSDPFVELPGDFNSSGRVDAADLAFWESAAESGGYFLEWQRNLGQSWLDLAPSGRLRTVPEPSAAVLVVLAALAALGRRATPRRHC